MNKEWHESYDVVVVGTGASGLSAAVTAEKNGMKSLVLEKLDRWGGSTAYSGGGLWIPANSLMLEEGAFDSEEEGLKYMENVIADEGTITSKARKEAFLKNGPEFVEFLKELGFKWKRAALYPDYYPDIAGAKTGRVIEGELFDGKKLGALRKSLMSPPGMPNVPISAGDAYLMPLFTQTWKAFKYVMGVAGKAISWGIRGKTPLSMGKSLVGQLMYILKERYNTPIWLNSPLKELIMEDGRVVGVVVEKDGETVNVEAKKGVLLGAGGFPHSKEYRQKHQGIGTDWSSAAPGNTGDAIAAGEGRGAATALMDESWWGGSFYMNGQINFSVYERSYPGCILVDRDGERYVNESTSYVDLGRAMLDRDKEKGNAAPSWLILDAKHRKRYLFGMLMPGMTPKKYIEDGTFIKAESIRDLAQQTEIDEQKLSRTIEQFNSYARQGIDEDLRRGDTIYDRYYSDYRVLPNSTLAPIENAPFWAIKFYPGDLGTKGGLVTDEYARVLKEDGTPFEGLYASGNNTASVMGRTYPGPGSTIGPACTFSFIAMKHLAGKKRESSDES